jgi:hypothetical protein
MDTDALLRDLEQSGGAAVRQGQRLDGLDLHGRVVEAPLNLSGARFDGLVDLTQAELRGGLLAAKTWFGGGLNARRSVVSGEVLLSNACFSGPVDLSYSQVRGRVYAWRARFQKEATFRQMIVSPSAGRDRSFVFPGETNFSWAWFQSQARFERCRFEGPVYFWRTRFFGLCAFDETSFEQDATFMGLPCEVSLCRNELGWSLFSRLEDLGLIQRDDEEVAVVDGRELAIFGQLANVPSHQELAQRMAAVGLSAPEQARLMGAYLEQAGPMFARSASLQRLRILQPRQVKFIAVSGRQWDLSGTDLTAIGFYNAAQEAVPVSIGLGHVYQRVFISYGGPDQPVAERFNRAFQNVGVDTYYYPEDSVPGRVIDEEMQDGVAGYDRVLLICSLTSPQRPGWQFELRRALEREATQGEGSVLILAAIDEGLWTPWPDAVEPLRQRLLGRTVADFRGVPPDGEGFNNQLGRVLAALSRTETALADPVLGA